MKTSQVDRPGEDLEFCRIDSPSRPQLKRTGHTDTASISESQADIINQDLVTLKRRRDLKAVQRQG